MNKQIGLPCSSTVLREDAQQRGQQTAAAKALDQRVQVAFRINRSDYLALKRKALEAEVTVNELMLRALRLLKIE